MSTKYKHGDHVPTEVLAKRLDELADVVGRPGEERDRELTLRIPAELDRDADLVLSEAAQRLLKMEAERDEAFAKGKRAFEDLRRVEAERNALAAHLNAPAIDNAIGALGHAQYWQEKEELESWKAGPPATSLARMKQRVVTINGKDYLEVWDDQQFPRSGPAQEWYPSFDHLGAGGYRGWPLAPIGQAEEGSHE